MPNLLLLSCRGEKIRTSDHTPPRIKKSLCIYLHLFDILLDTKICLLHDWTLF